MLRITSSGEAATTVVAVSGEVDLSTSGQLAEAIEQALGAPGAKRVEVDLAEVSFMDSAGLRVLVAGMKQANGQGAQLVATGPQPQVRKVFEITGLDEALGMTASDHESTDSGHREPVADDD